jgi:AcrR family transcriptional regulator
MLGEIAEPRSPRAEQARSTATRAALVAAARELFGKHGYHATGTNDVVARAAVTRGALYHHFDSKEDLFEVVYRQAAKDLSEASTAATLALSGRTWPRVIASVRVYLNLLSANREMQRILVIDGVSVFGWERWRALERECRLPGWIETLRLLIEKGVLEDCPRERLAHLVVALLDDAALSIAHADDPERVVDDVMVSLEILLRGLKGDARTPDPDR